MNMSTEPQNPQCQPDPMEGSKRAHSWGGEIGAFALFVLSLVFIVGGLKLGLGSPFRLGTGAFPFISGSILAVLSVFVGIHEWRRAGQGDAPDWISFLAIVAAIVVFASSADRFGLVPAAFLSVVIASFPDRSLPFGGKAILGATVSVACWVLFIRLLNLPFKAFVGI